MSSPIPERPVVDGDWDAWGAGLDAEARKIVGLGARALVKNIVTGPYTVVPADVVDRLLHCTASTSTTVTLPSGVPQESAIPWRQAGSGQITFAPASGMSLVSRGGATRSAGQWAGGVVTCVADGVWLLEGDIA